MHAAQDACQQPEHSIQAPVSPDKHNETFVVDDGQTYQEEPDNDTEPCTVMTHQEADMTVDVAEGNLVPDNLDLDPVCSESPTLASTDNYLKRHLVDIEALRKKRESTIGKPLPSVAVLGITKEDVTEFRNDQYVGVEDFLCHACDSTGQDCHPAIGEAFVNEAQEGGSSSSGSGPQEIQNQERIGNWADALEEEEEEQKR